MVSLVATGLSGFFIDEYHPLPDAAAFVINHTMEQQITFRLRCQMFLKGVIVYLLLIFREEQTSYLCLTGTSLQVNAQIQLGKFPTHGEYEPIQIRIGLKGCIFVLNIPRFGILILDIDQFKRSALFKVDFQCTTMQISAGINTALVSHDCRRSIPLQVDQG